MSKKKQPVKMMRVRKVTTSDNLQAACDYRDSVLDRADGTMNGFPAWHGWVIVDAYLAGIKASRTTVTIK